MDSVRLMSGETVSQHCTVTNQVVSCGSEVTILIVLCIYIPTEYPSRGWQVVGASVLTVAVGAYRSKGKRLE